jgi:hypothetical protein
MQVQAMWEVQWGPREWMLVQVQVQAWLQAWLGVRTMVPWRASAQVRVHELK